MSNIPEFSYWEEKEFIRDRERFGKGVNKMCCGNKRESNQDSSSITNLYTVKITVEANKLFESVKESKSISSILLGLASLVDSHNVYQRYEIERYSPSTGKPESYHWSPYGSWDGVIWIRKWGGTGEFLISENNYAFKIISSFCNGQKRVFCTRNGIYSIEHKTNVWRSGGKIDDHFKVEKIGGITLVEEGDYGNQMISIPSGRSNKKISEKESRIPRQGTNLFIVDDKKKLK